MESSVNNGTEIDKKISINRPLTCTQCDQFSNGENIEGTDTSYCLRHQDILTSDLQENNHVKYDNVNSSENQSFENEQAEIVVNKNINDPQEISIHTNDEENLKSNTTQRQNEEQIEASVKNHMKPTLDAIRIVMKKNKQLMVEIDQLNERYKSQSSEHLRQHEQITKQLKIFFIIICVFAFICVFCTVTYMKVNQLQQNMSNDFNNLIKKNEDLQHQIGQLTRSQLDLDENLTKLEKLLSMTQDFRSEEIEHKTYLNKLPVTDQILNLEQCRNELESEIDCTQSVKKHVRAQLRIPNIDMKAEWTENGVSVVGGNGKGNELNQISFPQGIYVDDNQIIYVADTSNRRIVEWKSGEIAGQSVANGFREKDQLKRPVNVIIDENDDSFIICDYEKKQVIRWPRRSSAMAETIISNIGCWDLIMDDNGYLYVSDVDKHEVQQWKIGDSSGKIVAGGNEKGSDLSQLNYPYYIFVSEDSSVYVSDTYNHRIVKWVKDAKEGIIVAGDQDEGSGLTQLSYPRGIIVDKNGTIYVAEGGNHRVTRWLKGETQGQIIIGKNGFGRQSNQLHDPNDISFDDQNNLYVVEYANHRVQKFSIKQS